MIVKVKLKCKGVIIRLMVRLDKVRLLKRVLDGEWMVWFLCNEIKMRMLLSEVDKKIVVLMM